VNGPTGSRPALTFFFPAFNEEANIERTVATALEAIGPIVSPLEVLAIDDGSTDRTPELGTGAADPGSASLPAEPWLRRRAAGRLRAHGEWSRLRRRSLTWASSAAC
jgi:hypothetical protein